MIESPKNMPAFLLNILPKDMCRELFRVFSIEKICDLDEKESIMLWRSLIHLYFPYLVLDEKNTTPKSLMNTFMNERQNTENHLSETEGVIENIDANLMMSALSGNIKLIEKADLNTSSKEALYGLALANGHYKVLFKLDAEALKRTLSFVADIRGNKALLNIMENVGKIICKKVDSRWIFQLAFESECWDVMLWIHENYNVSNRDLKKTLVKFSSEGHLDWVKLILEKCNNIHISQLEAAILGALQNGHVAVIRLIMNNYPDINIDELALQALEDAAQKGDLARVKNILLVYDSMDNNYLLNVLKKAIKKGHFEVFRYIIENVQGINLKVQVPELLYIAAKYQQREIVRFLQMVSPSSAGKALWKASFFGYLKRVKLILEECPTISVEEKEKAQRANKNPIGSATYNIFKNVLAESIEKQKTHLADHERFFLQYYENAWYNAGLNVQDEHDPKMNKLSKNQSSCILS